METSISLICSTGLSAAPPAAVASSSSLSSDAAAEFVAGDNNEDRDLLLSSSLSSDSKEPVARDDPGDGDLLEGDAETGLFDPMRLAVA